MGLRPDAITALAIIVPGLIIFTVIGIAVGVKYSQAYSYLALVVQAILLFLVSKRHNETDWPLLSLAALFFVTSLIAHDVLA